MPRSACETPGWKFLVGSRFKPRLDSSEVSVHTFRLSCQLDFDPRCEDEAWNRRREHYPLYYIQMKASVCRSSVMVRKDFTQWRMLSLTLEPGLEMCTAQNRSCLDGKTSGSKDSCWLQNKKSWLACWSFWIEMMRMWDLSLLEDLFQVLDQFLIFSRSAESNLVATGMWSMCETVQRGGKEHLPNGI